MASDQNLYFDCFVESYMFKVCVTHDVFLWQLLKVCYFSIFSDLGGIGFCNMGSIMLLVFIVFSFELVRSFGKHHVCILVIHND